jgi:hypothetical protein
MYLHLAGSSLSSVGALSAPPKALLRHFSCGAAQLAAVRAIVGPAVTADQLRASLQAALVDAVTWTSRAAYLLRRTERSKGDTARLFEESFGTRFSHIPSWRPAGQTWDRGDVVRARLLFITKLLAGGSIHFFCWGSPAFCPECTTVPPNYYACSSWGKKYVICLGKAFWDDWKAGRTDSMASTLVHESLHIYFGQLIAHGEKGRYGDTSCYQRFVLLMAGRPLPDRFKTRCAPKPPVGDFPPPPPGIRYASAAPAGPSVSGLGWINTGIDVPMRHIECSSASVQKIIDIGPFASREEALERLTMDIGHAAFVAHNSATALAAREEKAITAFKETFGVDPFRTDLPAGRWTGGKIVQARFAGAFKLLNSGAILYSCWGLPRKAGGPESNPNYTIKVKPNNYWMALGRKYWEESDNDVRAAMCLSAALRIAYGEWVKEGLLNRQANQVTCYIKFGFRLLDADLPAFVANTCPVMT